MFKGTFHQNILILKTVHTGDRNSWDNGSLNKFFKKFDRNWSLSISCFVSETMSPLYVRSKVCMAPFNVWSKVFIAPIHVESKVCKFAPHMDGSNADFALHMEGRHADFALHNKRRHSFKDQIKAKNSNFCPFSKTNI